MMATSEATVSRGSRFWRAIDERLGLNELAYKVPEHGNTLAYTLGGITFFGFIVLALTGIVLTQFYHPHPTEANASVRAIITDVPLGAFVRSVHFWAAQAVVVSVTLHAARVFITAAYKRPREVNWLVGVALLAVTIGFFFTGTVLKWDQESFEALEHNIEISTFLGAFGTFFSPSFAAGVPLLTRLYSVHVSVLPLLLVLLLLAHVFYIRHFGISPLPMKRNGGEPEKLRPFSTHLKKIVGYGLVLLAVVAALAVLFPAPLGPEPIEGIEVTKPPWPFLWLYTIENVWGIQWLLPASITPFLALVIIPFIDRGDERDPRRRKAIVVAFLVGIAILFALMIVAILSAPQAHVGG